MSYKTTGLKRKRTTAMMVYGPARAFAPPKPKRTGRRFVPGRDRQAGFYGRYSGVNAELKFFDVTYDDAVVAATGTLEQAGSVINIGQGVTEIQRVGRKCTIRSIDWRFTVTLPVQDAVGIPVSGDTVRVILFLDKQCNGATATVSGDAGILAGTTIHSHRELTNTGRFTLLMDRLININYSGLAADAANQWAQGAVVKNYHKYWTCNFPIEYNNTTGAIAEIRSNNIAVMLISDKGIAGFASQFRFRFSDA